MECPRCQRSNYKKDGIVIGKQRYQCRDCLFKYTTTQRGKPKEVKKLALHMYLEGLGFSSIGRIIGVSDVAVLKWIRQAAQMVKEALPKRERKVVEVMELDELWHYIGKKNGSVGSGWLLIELPKELLVGSKVVVARRRGDDSGTRLNI